MDDTQQAPPASQPGAEDAFDPRRLRSIADMRRSRDDRLIGGVCAGAAKYLGIDPIIVRVVIAVLTVAGFAGVIVYAAAWFLLPPEDADKSVAADWFNLDRNEEQVRVAGLVAAGVLAALAIVGDNGYAWWGVPWFLLPLAALYYLFVVRPRRHRDNQPAPAAGAAPSASPEPSPVTAQHRTMPVPASARRDRSPALTLLTVSLVAIAVAVTRIYADLGGSVPWTTYVAVALAVTGVGLVVGTFFGNGGPLIAIGGVLAAALAVGSLLPSARIGIQTATPASASGVVGEYTHGVGLLELDLTDLDDADQLLGSTLELRSGAGQIKVIVPRDLNIEVDARLGAGQIDVLGRQAHGADNRLELPAGDDGPALTLRLRQRFGNIEVIGR